MGAKGFRDVAEVLNRLSVLGEQDAVREMAALFKKVDADCLETLLRIMRMDFGEASRLIGTHLLRRIVSEALAGITLLKQDEAEVSVQSGRLRDVLSRRSSILLEKGLSIDQAYLGMLEACRISGKSSIGFKVKSLTGLLNKASDEEAFLIVNMLMGRQKPVDDRLILKALGEAFHGSAAAGIGMMGGEAGLKDIYKVALQVVKNAGRAESG
ncbi:MAG: hypothetical protein FGF53_03430 [Candidatus Brockarchaeota archaeon]|nr:hypothetical protein [Candidatus Brockarchaeota archaeon]MBO3808912.1 hypothetical protein [Candidatus Brockarchaeota archaeon]